MRDAAESALPAFVRHHMAARACQPPQRVAGTGGGGEAAPGLQDLADCLLLRGVSAAPATELRGLHRHSQYVRRLMDSDGRSLARIARVLMNTDTVHV